MHKILSFLLCGLLLSTPVWAQDVFRLMVFGDSLSAGYGVDKKDAYFSKLQTKLLKEGYDNIAVIDESKSGDKTADGLARLPAALAKKPHAVLIELGINDVLNNIEIKEATNNLKKIIEGFQEIGTSVMLIGMVAPSTYNYEYRAAFQKMYKDLAQEYKTPLYPFFLEGVMKQVFGTYDMKYLQTDGAHPTAEGIQIMVNNTFPAIKKFLEEQSK